jgi:enoyl-[acyl-carrier-protein] reductase (NADH)
MRPRRQTLAKELGPRGIRVNAIAIGPIRQIVQSGGDTARRYLAIAPIIDGKPGEPVQVQAK